MKTKNILLGALVLALLVAVSLWSQNVVRIDSCLDGGGRWDQDQQICEGIMESHPSSDVCFGSKNAVE